MSSANPGRFPRRHCSLSSPHPSRAMTHQDGLEHLQQLPGI
jgi:hypothetical protein